MLPLQVTSPMPSCLALVIEQFPNLRERVTSLFHSDVVFRELCEDYEICTNALARQPSSPGLREEYSALQLRLEAELLMHLDESPRPHRRPHVAKSRA